MKHHEGNFQGLKGLGLYFQCWLPDAEPRAILVIAHGFGEHSGRYANLVGYFVPRGLALYALDHRGHGRSEGQRVHVDQFSDYVDDLKTFFDIVRTENPGKKIFLVGHSMGAHIALLYAARYQGSMTGLIISGGGILRPDEPPPAPRPAGQSLATSFLSRDPEVIKAYIHDPLVYHGPMPAGGMGGMTATTPEIVRLIKLPVLVMAGNDVADGARSKTLFEFQGSEDKTLKLYDGLRHEIFNEPEYPLVMRDIEDWLNLHMAGKQS